jgi:large subunit ribosomal protein L34e
MPAPRFRSRTFKRVHKKLPGGKTKLFYLKRKPKKAHCASCGKILHGVPHELPYKMRTMAKTKKRPERIYGGVFCSKCTREIIKQKLRSENV